MLLGRGQSQVALVLRSLEPSDHVHYCETTLIPQRLWDSKHLRLNIPAEVSDPPLVTTHCWGPDVGDQVLSLLQYLQHTVTRLWRREKGRQRNISPQICSHNYLHSMVKWQ